MRQAEVQIGGSYRTKVGGELVVVMVSRTAGKRGGSRLQFECLNSVTQRRLYRTAAKLRPLVEQPKPATVKVVPSVEEFMAGLREAAHSMPDTL